MRWRRPILLLIVLGTGQSVIACAGTDASGCTGVEQPSADPMTVGDSLPVELRAENGVWVALDIAEGYWTSGEPTSLPDGAYAGVAELLKAGSVSQEGTILVDLGDRGTVTFNGPVPCM